MRCNLRESRPKLGQWFLSTKLSSNEHPNNLFNTNPGRLVVLMCLIVPLSLAQPVPNGIDFQVNENTTSRQWHGDIAVNGDGTFVIVWEDQSISDGSSSRVSGKRYDSDGSVLLSEFQINTYTTEAQYAPSIAMESGGAFVVVWGGYGNATRGQRYDAAAATVGGEFVISSAANDYTYYPDVAKHPNDNDFTVVWLEGFSGTNVIGRRFNSTASPLAAEFPINTYTTGNQTLPQISSAPNGDFVVVWQSPGSPGDDSGSDSVQARTYDAAGNPTSAQFQVNTFTTNGQIHPDVTHLSTGEYIIAWTSGHGMTTALVQGQRYNSDGTTLGGEFTMNPVVDAGGGLSVTTGPNDEYVASWSVGNFVYLRAFSSAASPFFATTQVNTYTTGNKNNPVVGTDSSGNVIVTWEGTGGSPGNDTNSQSMQAVLMNGPVPVALQSFSVD